MSGGSDAGVDVDEAELDRLYAFPRERFVPERDALARRLRTEGERAAADAVKRLEKPSVAAALVNRLARERPEELQAFLRARDELRRAHTGDEGDFRQAADAERAARDRLLAAAPQLVEGGGRPASDAVLRRVAATLEAAAANGENRTLLERGRLSHELEPRGFELLAGLAFAAPPRRARAATRARPPTEGESRRRRIAEAQEEVARARERAREVEEQAVAAEREATRLRYEADRAAVELERAEQQLASLREPGT